MRNVGLVGMQCVRHGGEQTLVHSWSIWSILGVFLDYSVGNLRTAESNSSIQLLQLGKLYSNVFVIESSYSSVAPPVSITSIDSILAVPSFLSTKSGLSETILCAISASYKLLNLIIATLFL